MSQSKNISVTVINAKADKKTFEVEKNALISEFKEVVAKHFNAQPSQLRLIFAGKILKDQDTLTTYNIKDGSTVHFIIKTDAPQNNPTTTSSTNIRSARTRRPFAIINVSPSNLRELTGNSSMVSNLVDMYFNETNDDVTTMRESNVTLIGGHSDILHNYHGMPQQIVDVTSNQSMGSQDTEISEEFNGNTSATLCERGGELNPQQRQENHDRSSNVWFDSTGTYQSDSSNRRSVPTSVNVPLRRPIPIRRNVVLGDRSLIDYIIGRPENILPGEAMHFMEQSMTEQQQINLTVWELSNNVPVTYPYMVNNPEVRSRLSGLMRHISPVIGGQYFFQRPNVNTTANDSTVPTNIPSTEGPTTNANSTVLNNFSSTQAQNSLTELIGRMRSHLPRNIYPPPTRRPPPEQVFRYQLEELFAMGFSNREASLEALIHTNGSSYSAAAWLIAHGYFM